MLKQKTINEAVDYISAEYMRSFRIYDEDNLESLMVSFYNDNSYFECDQRIEIWKSVSESLKNNL